MRLVLRLEEEKDFKEVENLTREIFWDVCPPGCEEHLVIHNLRNKKYYIKNLDYVLELDGKIIGSIFYALGMITNTKGEKVHALMFGPVCISPEYQKKGYSKILIRETLKKAKKMGYKFVLITGNPEFYHQFGFVSASKYGIYYEGTDQKEETNYFMIKLFDKEFDLTNYQGIYIDRDCYFVDKKELEEFEKEFPYKEKKFIPKAL